MSKIYDINLVHATEVRVAAENEEEAKEMALHLWKDVSKHAGVLEIDDIQCINEEIKDDSSQR